MAERAGSVVAATATARRRVQGRTLVLAYHNVLPPGEQPRGDRSLHLAFADFCAQLDLLQSQTEVVPLPRLLEPQAAGGRPRVAVTFDDAYRGAVTVGIGELARRGLPATIFVAPGLLGDRSFWWDQAALATGSDQVPPGLRTHALGPCRGDAEVIRADWRRRGTALESVSLPVSFRSATEAEVAAAAGVPGISLGAHSWSHPNLAVLDDVTLEPELTRPLEWLKTRHPAAAIPWLAYPYGLVSPGVQQATARAGYAAGLRVDGGWLARGVPPAYATPRLNVPAGISPDRFRIRLAALPWL